MIQQISGSIISIIQVSSWLLNQEPFISPVIPRHARPHRSPAKISVVLYGTGQSRLLPYDWGNNHPLACYSGVRLRPRVLTHNQILRKKYFTSSDPHRDKLFCHSYWHHIWKYTKNICSTFFFGILSDILFWHSIRAFYLAYNLTLFWHPIWHLFWHFFGILSGILSEI